MPATDRSCDADTLILTAAKNAQADYLLSADYAATGDVGKARRFETACRQLLLVLPKRASRGQGQSEVIELDLEQLRQELQAVKRWLNANSDRAGAGTAYSDFSDFRGPGLGVEVPDTGRGY